MCGGGHLEGCKEKKWKIKERSNCNKRETRLNIPLLIFFFFFSFLRCVDEGCGK